MPIVSQIRQLNEVKSELLREQWCLSRTGFGLLHIFLCVSDPIWSDYIIIKLLQLMEQVFSVIGNVAVAAVNDVLNYPFIIEL